MGRVMVYEWRLSYRIDHWVSVMAVAVLVFTGFYIHWPFIAGGTDSYIMAWMRFFHFLSAYALILGFIVRVYLAFNSSSRKCGKFIFGSILLRDFFCLMKNIPDMLGYYLFIKKTHKDYWKYNPLQALAYLSMMLLTVFMIFTGLSLYKGRLFGFIEAYQSFAWVKSMLGGESYTRVLHFLGMWVFIIFISLHVYFSLLHTLIEKDKTFTSIFTGYKLRKKTS